MLKGLVRFINITYLAENTYLLKQIMAHTEGDLGCRSFKPLQTKQSQETCMNYTCDFFFCALKHGQLFNLSDELSASLIMCKDQLDLASIDFHSLGMHRFALR